jgi:P2-related tail formation protein
MEWMEIKIIVPADEGSNLLPHLREQLEVDQLDEDWTVEKRAQDNTTLEYHPYPEPPDRKF